MNGSYSVNTPYGNGQYQPVQQPAPQYAQQPVQQPVQQPSPSSGNPAGQGAPQGRRGQKPPASDTEKVRRLSRICAILVAVAIVAIGFSIATGVRYLGAGSETAAVVVASSDIRAGSVITESMLAIEEVPVAYVSSASVSETSSLVGKTAINNIYARQQITTDMTYGQDNRSSLSKKLSEGMYAMTFNVDTQSGLSGLLQQGDRIDIIATKSNSVTGEISTKVFLEDVKVIALDASLVDNQGNAYSSVTVELEREQGLVLANALETSTINVMLHDASRAAEQAEQQNAR